MAGRHEEEGSTTAQILLHRLREGQEELKRSLRVLQRSPGRHDGETGRRRGEKNLKRGRSVSSPLARVASLPRKRARTVLLSPDLSPDSPSHSSPPPLPYPSHPHRRLSSTPKGPTAPLLDLSLEDALLSQTRQKEKTAGISREEGEGGPNLSQGVVGTSKRGSKKKGRGLTVSFIEEDRSRDAMEDQDGSKVEHKSLDFAAERELGASLIESLNSSRFGALEQRLSLMRKTHTFPRRYAGADPRLGYDWIAGLLDVDSSLGEREDEYFEEMKEFRRVNRSECCQSEQALLPGSVTREVSGEVYRDASEGEDNLTATTCTCVNSYVMNGRLFPVPLHSSEPGSHCPVCEGRHKQDPSPHRYVRVSVPRSTLQTPYLLRPHRRRSSHHLDTLGLSQHCQAGWETAQPSIVPPQPPVDLKSSVGGGAGVELVEKGGTEKKRSRDLLNTSHSVEYSLRSRPRAIGRKGT